MKNRAFIVDSAFASALGPSSENETFRKLYAGESAVTEIDRFDTAGMTCKHAALLKCLRPDEFPDRLRELMKKSLEQLGEIPHDTFIIWTGVKENAEYIEAKSNSLDVSGLPVYSFQVRKWISDFLHTDGKGMELNAACASSTAGIALASEMINNGSASSVLVCAADIVSRFVFSGFSALRGLSASGVCSPFDAARDGLILGEASAAILITDGKKAYNRKSSLPLVSVKGWGISNDANHITGPSRDGAGLITAINAALKTAVLPPDEISAFSAHGTGTVYNDAMELAAIESIWKKQCFPVFSTKGALGHTLGAAGAMETIICMRCFADGAVPPTVFCETPEPRALGRVMDKIQKFSGSYILKTNSGFGGVNAAIILEKE